MIVLPCVGVKMITFTTICVSVISFLVLCPLVTKFYLLPYMLCSYDFAQCRCDVDSRNSCLFGGRQNIFLPISRSKFVIKCASKVLKIGWQLRMLCDVQKYFWIGNFVWGNGNQGKSLFSRNFFKFCILFEKCLTRTSNVLKDLTLNQVKNFVRIQSLNVWIISLADANSLFKIDFLAQNFYLSANFRKGKFLLPILRQI